MNKFIFIALFFLSSLTTYGQKDTSISGYLTDAGVLSGGYQLPDSEKNQFKSQFANIDITGIEHYFSLIKKAKNSVDTLKAKKHLKRNVKLSDFNINHIDEYYLFPKAYHLGILFLPCFIVNDQFVKNKVLVSIDRKTFEDLGGSIAENKIYKMRCKYLGNFVNTNMKVYKAITVD